MARTIRGRGPTNEELDMKKNTTLRMVGFTLALAMSPAPAQALTVNPSPTPKPTVTMVCRSWSEPYGTLLTAKAHPSRVIVVGVDCGTSLDLNRGDARRQACAIIAATYGRWIINRAYKGQGKQLILEPLRCADVLPVVPHGAIDRLWP